MNKNDSIGAEITTIEKTMHKDQRNYWRDPEIQDRYRALLEARSGNKPTPRRRGDLETEKKQIEAAMKDRRSDYFLGPRNVDGETEMAARYCQILEWEAERARVFMVQRDALSSPFLRESRA